MIMKIFQTELSDLLAVDSSKRVMFTGNRSSDKLDIKSSEERNYFAPDTIVYLIKMQQNLHTFLGISDSDSEAGVTYMLPDQL